MAGTAEKRASRTNAPQGEMYLRRSSFLGAGGERLNGFISAGIYERGSGGEAAKVGDNEKSTIFRTVRRPFAAAPENGVKHFIEMQDEGGVLKSDFDFPNRHWPSRPCGIPLATYDRNL